MSDPIVIVGGGLAAQRCCEALRARGHDGPIRMVCAEPVAPYDRPPLSKDVLRGELDVGELALRPSDWHAQNDVELLLGRRATRLDPGGRRVDLDDGARLRYGRLLIATGARPLELPLLRGLDNVHTLRGLADAERLRDCLRPGARIAVVGAGLIGLEVAAAAKRLGAEVTVIEALATPLERVLGRAVGAWLASVHREEDVDVLCSTTVDSFRGAGTVEALVLADGRHVPCDAVIVGIGVVPDADWLHDTLGVMGVATNAVGRSPLPGVWAAGDVALTRDAATGALESAGHWEAAARGGAAVAHDMLGLEAPPAGVPTFWSDQFETRIQVAGRPAMADDLELLEGDPRRRDFCVLLTRSGTPVAGVAVGRPRAFAALRRSLSPVPPLIQEAA